MRPGQKIRKTPGPDFGVRVVEPGFPSAAGGWWDDFGAIGCCVGAYQGRAAADYPSSLVNLANPGVNDLTEIGGGPPGWNAVQGWFNFAVLNRLLDTGWVPANDQSWSMIAQYANVTNTGIVCGAWSFGATYFALRPSDGVGTRYFNGAGAGAPPPLLTGNLCVAGNQGYRNGAWDAGPIGGWTAASVTSVGIGALNAAVPGMYIAGDVWAVAIYDCVLTAPQVAAVAAWMAAL